MHTQPAGVTTEAAALVAGVHPFEAAGMGKAPFRYVGEVDQNIKYGQATGLMKTESGAVVEFQTTPGGTCEYCGQYIVSMFRIESADGVKSVVGSDCVTKCNPENVKLVSAVKKAVNARRTVQSHARADAKIAAARERFPAVRATLAAKPHPKEYRAKNGATLADWCEFMLWKAGRKGMTEAARVVMAEAGE